MELRLQDPLSIQRVAQIGANVLGEFLNIPVKPIGEATQRPSVSTRVKIEGAWNGTVDMHFTENLARRIASRMLPGDGEAVSQTDIEDAISEIANIMAGNIKALLPSPSHLSIPEVIHDPTQDGSPHLQIKLFDEEKGMVNILISRKSE